MYICVHVQVPVSMFSSLVCGQSAEMKTAANGWNWTNKIRLHETKTVTPWQCRSVRRKYKKMFETSTKPIAKKLIFLMVVQKAWFWNFRRFWFLIRGSACSKLRGMGSPSRVPSGTNRSRRYHKSTMVWHNLPPYYLWLCLTAASHVLLSETTK